MKILALEHDVDGVTRTDVEPYLKEEARRVYELQQAGVLREIHFRADRKAAVLVLECADEAEAQAHLATLPLVQHNLISFEIIPLAPYSGLERLFAQPVSRALFVVHADWSLHPRKRWQTAARRTTDGRFQVSTPEPVGDPATWLDRLRQTAGPNTPILLGLDLPLGVPLAWAQRAGVEDFAALLPRLGQGEWRDFYRPAEQLEEISLRRPFYPYRPGGTSRQQLVDGLGLNDADELYRVCDRATATRDAASPLFWTLGAKQVGKAAISAWRDLLGPALRERDDVVLWPFEGSLDELLADGRIVVAESYPGEFYSHFDLSFPVGPDGKRGKRVQASRAGVAPPLLAWTAAHQVVLDAELERALQNGFGPQASGEDLFDATVGLLGMLNVILGNRPAGEPAGDELRRVEGWILGQLPSA